MERTSGAYRDKAKSWFKDQFQGDCSKISLSARNIMHVNAHIRAGPTTRGEFQQYHITYQELQNVN